MANEPKHIRDIPIGQLTVVKHPLCGVTGIEDSIAIRCAENEWNWLSNLDGTFANFSIDLWDSKILTIIDWFDDSMICECGSLSVGCLSHSSWCPSFKE